MKRKGFTIIELLIVMAVIAILVGIAIPSFRGMQIEAWKTKAEGDVRVLKIALESHYKNTGAFPAEANYQTTLMGATPRVLEKSLKDPFKTTDDYVYKLSTNGSYYVVFSIGPNATATITGMSDAGSIEGSAGDDIYETNGY